MQNYELHIAEQFVLHTAKNVFLTGRAGTGKTTFLQKIVKETNKNTVVVAPTGVAAINAGGVTIHSMFQLPLTAFIPSNDEVDLSICTNRFGLSKHMKYRSERRKLIENLELLIIDEISMVRADLLDAIDFVLKRIRKNTMPFGGVQLLVIGDLFQLSPVVRGSIWSILGQYYKSPFFFDSQAWAVSDVIKIELNTIYRQRDEHFINILNNIRLGVKRIEDLELLNRRKTKIDEDDNTLVLTTHNRKADKINNTKIDNLPGRKRRFAADISGRFNESAYPTPEVIELKKGAQVMFIRNDIDGMYFNGKLGEVQGFSDDFIIVRGLDDGEIIYVEKEEWKNTRYTLDKEKKTIEQETIGSFEQYPLKLAWAITVHKSQGLTFDEVCVDLSDTFAPGQLYVALSRSRTLEGLKLMSEIKADNIITDKRILEYHQEIELDKDIEHTLSKAKQEYEDLELIKAFQFGSILNQFDDWKELILGDKVPEQGNAFLAYKDTYNAMDELAKIGQGFQNQLSNLFKNRAEQVIILDRGNKAITYFTANIHEEVIKPLEEHISKYKIKKKTRRYIRLLNDITNELWELIDKLYTLKYRNKDIYTGENKYRRAGRLKAPKKLKRGIVKGETQRISLELFEKGNSLVEIAKLRNLKLSTIEGHMSRWIENGTIHINRLMKNSKVKVLEEFMKENEDISLNELMAKSPVKTTYGELRWIRAHIKSREG